MVRYTLFKTYIDAINALDRDDSDVAIFPCEGKTTLCIRAPEEFLLDIPSALKPLALLPGFRSTGAHGCSGHSVIWSYEVRCAPEEVMVKLRSMEAA